MSDDDFPTPGADRVSKIRPELERFGKALAKRGYHYSIFVTDSKIDQTSEGATVAGAAVVSMSAGAMLSHVATMAQDIHYIKAALITFLLFKRGKLKIKDMSKSEGLFSKFKKLF